MTAPPAPTKWAVKAALPNGASAEVRIDGASGSPPSCFE